MRFGANLNLKIFCSRPEIREQAMVGIGVAAAASRRPVAAASAPETAPVLACAVAQAGQNEEAREFTLPAAITPPGASAEGIRQAIERLERAVELDPDFAFAHSELADCYSLLNWYVEPPPPAAWQRARNRPCRAVEADPGLAEAHASLGFVKLHYDRDWEGAERELQKAIQLKPGTQVAHRWYAFSLSAMGRHEAAFNEMERAREISPQSPVLATARSKRSVPCEDYDVRSSNVIRRWLSTWRGGGAHGVALGL